MREKFIRWEPITPYQRNALSLLRTLQESGHLAYFVGGFCRDLIIGRDIHDIDITTSATPSEVLKIFSHYTTLDRDKDFGTIRIVHEGGAYEITSFRRESQYKDNRHPKKVSFLREPRQDVLRRDFTVNGMLYDPVSSILIDYVGGMKDVRNRCMRFIGDADKRIKEDALRMMRAIRFATVLDFGLNSSVMRSIKRNRSLITNVSRERIRDEFIKILMSDHASKGVWTLYNSGLLKHILPDLDLLGTIEQDSRYHAEGNVFIHSVGLLDHLPPDADLSLRVASLFHDIGKAKTTKKTIHGSSVQITSYGHEVVGAEMVPVILGAKGLHLSHEHLTKIRWLVRNHMMVFPLDKMKISKQMKWATHKWFVDLLHLNRADNLARITIYPDPLAGYRYGLSLYERGRKMLQGKSLEEFFRGIVTGNDVKMILGIRSGPNVGRQLREMRDLFFQGKILTRHDALEHLSKKAEDFRKRQKENTA